MNLLRSTFTFTLCLGALTTFGRQRTETELFSAVRTTLEQMPVAEIQAASNGRHAPIIGGELTILHQDSATAVIGYQQGGWAVVGKDDLLPEILGYSPTPFDPFTTNPGLQWWMSTMELCCRDRIERGVPCTVVAPDPTLYQPSMDAMVTARWGQEAPYYNMCPMGTTSSTGWGYEGNTTGRCVTGCVATGMAQVLYYHKSPASGVGSHSVNVPQAGGGSQKYTVNYEEAVYDWDNMLDSYYGSYSTEEADAVALLMYHCGVATDMQYATDGSGAYMSDCTEGLRRNFGFTNVSNPQRNSYSEDQWMEKVYTELNEGRPIIYAGDDMTYRAGHCFVLDGYDTRGYVHINWGWDGSSDGFFNIATLNAGGYSFSSYQEMVIGVEGDGTTRKGVRCDTLTVEAPGTLRALLDDSLLLVANRMTIYGDLNASDVAALRKFARSSTLRSIDLRKTTILEQSLADSAFALCDNLSKIVLPRGLQRIGSRAFAGCTKLRELRLYDRDVPKLGSSVFKDVKSSSAYLYVPAATKDKFKRTAQWRAFSDTNDNIVEFGSAVTVRNCVREQGQPNPEFSYSVVGDAISGEPELTCEADEESPVGKYPIVVGRGTIENQDVDLVDGYLIITEATQGIESITVDAAQPEAPMFDLNGRRINPANATHGIYLQGGRKVIL